MKPLIIMFATLLQGPFLLAEGVSTEVSSQRSSRLQMDSKSGGWSQNPSHGRPFTHDRQPEDYICLTPPCSTPPGANRESSLSRGRYDLKQQFWLLTGVAAGKVSFNSPWDDQPGDDIVKDSSDVRLSAYALRCGLESKQKLQDLMEGHFMQEQWAKIGAWGGSRTIIVLVDVLQDSAMVSQLYALDRAPGFWFWNEDDKIPQLAFATLSTGSFIYEVAAAPDRCYGVSSQLVGEFLQYAANRLRARKKAHADE